MKTGPITLHRADNEIDENLGKLYKRPTFKTMMEEGEKLMFGKGKARVSITE